MNRSIATPAVAGVARVTPEQVQDLVANVGRGLPPMGDVVLVLYPEGTTEVLPGSLVDVLASDAVRVVGREQVLTAWHAEEGNYRHAGERLASVLAGAL